MAKLNQNSNELSDNQDDLQQIKGISPSIAEALNGLGIYRFSDLANFTPESLANLLKTTTASISLQRIKRDNWLGQAQALANRPEEPAFPQAEAEETSQPSIESQMEETDQSAPQTLNPAKAEDPLMPPAESKARNEVKTSHENWRELANFFVSFGYSRGEGGEERLETRVHYTQVDTSEQWAGIVTTQLLNWMLTQANLPLPLEPETEVETPPPAEPSPVLPIAEETVILELSDLWVSEVRTPALAGGQRSMDMLRAESRLNLSGPATNKLTANQLPFRVELYLVNIETNRSNLIVSQEGQLISGELIYEIQQDFPLPAIGSYQLYMVARLLPPGDAATHLQGPIIRVEA